MLPRIKMETSYMFLLMFAGAMLVLPVFAFFYWTRQHDAFEAGYKQALQDSRDDLITDHSWEWLGWTKVNEIGRKYPTVFDEPIDLAEVCAEISALPNSQDFEMARDWWRTRGQE